MTDRIWRPAAGQTRPDGGFTMVEVLVSLAVITALMASLGTYFTQTMQVSRNQAQIDAATRIAQTAVEGARGFGGPTLLVGRAKCGSCVSAGGYDPDGYLTNTVRWDAQVSGTAPTVPLPSTPQTVVVNGVTYNRYYFVGKCYQAAAGGACGATTTFPVVMVRLVVGVSWVSNSCAYSFCIRAASAMFSADPTDPEFTQ